MYATKYYKHHKIILASQSQNSKLMTHTVYRQLLYIPCNYCNICVHLVVTTFVANYIISISTPTSAQTSHIINLITHRVLSTLQCYVTLNVQVYTVRSLYTYSFSLYGSYDYMSYQGDNDVMIIYGLLTICGKSINIIQ